MVLMRWLGAHRDVMLAAQRLVVFLDLLFQKLLLVRFRHSDPLEAAVVTTMPSHSPLAILAVRNLRRSLVKSYLAGDEQFRVGIKLHELAGELFQEVIGHDVHRLLEQARPVSSSCRWRPSCRSCRADDMGEQGVAARMPRRTASFWCGTSGYSGSCPGNRGATVERPGAELL